MTDEQIENTKRAIIEVYSQGYRDGLNLRFRAGPDYATCYKILGGLFAKVEKHMKGSE